VNLARYHAFARSAVPYKEHGAWRRRGFADEPLHLFGCRACSKVWLVKNTVVNNHVKSFVLINYWNKCQRQYGYHAQMQMVRIGKLQL
jgi:hypothetical protein